MSPRIDGSWFWGWNYRYATRYTGMGGGGGFMRVGGTRSVIPHPMSEFSHLPSEVYGADPADLHRTYSIELRFELK